MKEWIINKTDSLVGIVFRDHEDVVYLIDYLNKSVIGCFPIFEDTDSRIAYSTLLGCVIIGSWRNEMKCYSLKDGKVLWTSPVSHFTWIDVVEESGKVIVSGLKDLKSSLALQVKTGRIYKKLYGYEYATSSHYVIGMSITQNSDKKSLTLYDRNLAFLTRVLWECWTIDSMGSDSNNNVVVAGPTEVCSFRSDGNGEATSLVKDFDRLEQVSWSATHNCFFGVASFYKGVLGLSLIRFNANFTICELVMPLDVGYCSFLKNGKHLVCNDGLILDMDEQREVERIDWKSIANI
jgi:hypothetical protein